MITNHRAAAANTDQSDARPKLAVDGRVECKHFRIVTVRPASCKSNLPCAVVSAPDDAAAIIDDGDYDDDVSRHRQRQLVCSSAGRYNKADERSGGPEESGR